MKSHLAVNPIIRPIRRSHRHLAIFLSVTALFNLASASVQLYLEPDIRSQKLEILQVGDPLLLDGQPVADPAKAVLGWQQVEKTATVFGFVPDAEIGKDLLPVDGTPVHRAANSESPTYGLYRDSMPSRILDRGLWWSLQVDMPVTAYFLPPMPAVVREGNTSDSGAVGASIGLFEVQDAEPSTQHSGSLANLPDSTGSVSEQRTESETPPPTRLLQGVMSQRFEGIFRKSRGFLGLRSPTNPYYLEGRSGARLAWIDTEAMIFTGALEDYIGQKVIVFGEMDPDAGAAKRTISARNMRQE